MAWNALTVATPNIPVKLASSYMDTQISGMIFMLQAQKKREAPVIDDNTGKAIVVMVQPSLSLNSQLEYSHNPGTYSNRFLSLLTMMMTTGFSTLGLQTTWHLIPMIFLIQLHWDEVMLLMQMGSLLRLQELEMWLYLLLFHYLILVPSLSNKLIFVRQVIANLICVVLMYYTFCLL